MQRVWLHYVLVGRLNHTDDPVLGVLVERALCPLRVTD